MRLNNKGFTLVEVLLIVIALCLIAGVGYYVYNANKVEKKESKTTQSNTVPKTKTEKTQKSYIELKELGIKIPFDNTDEDISYGQPQPDNGNYGYNFRSKKLESAYKRNCPTYTSNVWLLDTNKQSGTFDPQAQRARGEAGAPPYELLKQFDTFYIYNIWDASSSGGESCAPGFNELRDKLKEAFKNAEII